MHQSREESTATERRVLIVDGRPDSRARARMALEGHGFTVAAEVSHAADAIEAAARTRPDVCLLDSAVPGDGIRACSRITSAFPETTVIMYTGPQSDANLFDALRAGASGYLPKDTDPARLPFALRGALEGEAALPRSLVGRLIEEFRRRERRKRLSLRGRPGVDLTVREWDVLEFMAQRLTTAQMAERLFVSQVTVRTHVSSILRKLRVPDRAAAVALLEGN